MGITGATGSAHFYNIYGAWPGAERHTSGGRDCPGTGGAGDGDRGGAVGHVPMERGADFVSMITAVEPETFKVAAAEMCLEAGVRLLLHTTLDEVRQANGQVEGIVDLEQSRAQPDPGQAVHRLHRGRRPGGIRRGAFRGAETWRKGAYPAGFTFRHGQCRPAGAGGRPGKPRA